MKGDEGVYSLHLITYELLLLDTWQRYRFTQELLFSDSLDSRALDHMKLRLKLFIECVTKESSIPL